MLHKDQLGLYGEQKAQEYIKNLGYTLVDKRYRSQRWGEIDIICLDSDTLVFVEVKTRSSLSKGTPESAVNYYKQQALKRAAVYYAITHPKLPNSYRFDVVSVFLNNDTDPEITHYKNAF